MRHPAAGQFLPFSLVFILTAILAQIIHAVPQGSTTKAQPLTATRHSLKARVTFPSYQLDPSTILWPPNCAAEDTNICLGSTTVKGCTVEYCSKKVALTCWTHVYAIDLECLCNSMSSTTCPSCATGINNQLYLAWLSRYCPLASGWNGLPANWNTALPGFDILQIGQQVSSSGSNTIYYETDNPFTSQFITDKHDFVASVTPPSCIKSCSWLNTIWNTSIVDGDVATGLAGANLFPSNYTIGGAPQSQNLYLDLTAFCPGWSWSDLQGNCTGACTTNLDNTGLLWWLHETCGNIPGFTGLLSNWRDSLYVTNSTYPALSDFNTTWPKCIKAGNYSDCQLSATESNCTSARCGSFDQSGDCNSVSAISLECFCPQVKYGISCTANCALSWERVQYLHWLNDTCSVLAPGISLPSNWTTLLSVQRSEMLPWNWQVVNLSPSSNSQPHCPTASNKLLAFAAVNIAMLILIPFVSRRTVIKWFSCGYFGRQESRHWYYTGFLAVGLHLASNAINAVIIKKTPGYESTSIKDLTFFWCTRPRLAWLVVALLPYEAEKSMYFSATASILFGEVILQLFGAYNMGMAANYARRQKFLLRGHLVGSWYAKQAMIMYAGSMLWLTAVPFAIVACLWSVFGVSERIGRLSEYWTETRRLMKENCAIVATQVELLNAAKSTMKPIAGQVSRKQQVEGLQDRLSTYIDITLDEWDELTKTWKRMPTELRQEQKTKRTLKKRAEKAKDRLDRARQGTERWEQRFEATETIELELMDFDQAWFTTPTTRQDEAQAHQVEVESRIVVDPAQQTEVSELIAACRERILPFEQAIAEAQATIARDDARLRSIQQRQNSAMWTWRWKWRWRFVDWWQVLHLRNQYDVASRQRKDHVEELKAEQNNPQLRLEMDQAADLQAVYDTWKALFESKQNLKQNWEVNEEQWRLIAEKREEQEKKPNVGRFPLVVVVGMLLCWIAQWLWWAGYIGVAGDGYCPPKLPALASIWTLFSATGSMFGASF